MVEWVMMVTIKQYLRDPEYTKFFNYRLLSYKHLASMYSSLKGSSVVFYGKVDNECFF